MPEKRKTTAIFNCQLRWLQICYTKNKNKCIHVSMMCGSTMLLSTFHAYSFLSVSFSLSLFDTFCFIRVREHKSHKFYIIVQNVTTDKTTNKRWHVTNQVIKIARMMEPFTQHSSISIYICINIRPCHIFPDQKESSRLES